MVQGEDRRPQLALKLALESRSFFLQSVPNFPKNAVFLFLLNDVLIVISFFYRKAINNPRKN